MTIRQRMDRAREWAAVKLIEAGYWLASGRRMTEGMGDSTIPHEDEEAGGGYSVAMSDKAHRMVAEGAAAPVRAKPATIVPGPLPGSAAARLQAARDEAGRR